MKAIILAAGKGTRLGKYTENLPKCMLKFDGKPLIERQIETLRKCNIKDISIVAGYEADKINFCGVKKYINEDYDKTNMVASLFCAEKELNGDENIIVSYGDILYEKRTLEKLINCNRDICVTVDDNWQKYWKARFYGQLEDLESLEIGRGGNIIGIGTPNCKAYGCHARYVGLLKFSKKGIDIFKKIYEENKNLYFDKNEKWLNSKSFKQAYMTDMLQAIINEAYNVWPVHIENGWLEFDTVQDYEKYNGWLKTGSLSRFFSFNK